MSFPHECSQPVIFLMGATATGKSGVALDLAQRFPMEIVNADSVQVYRGMDIGAAKPTPREQSLVPHHLLDLVEPNDPFSAGRYRSAALAVMAAIHDRGRIPLLVGGTGLYFRVVERGVAPVPDVPESVCQALRHEAATTGWPALHDRLASLDPLWAAQVSRQDGQRILRGLSVAMATGRALSHWLDQDHEPLPNPLLKIVLDLPRPEIYQRIETRFHQMMAMGLLEEAAGLLARGYARDLPAMKAVGYRQLFGHLADGQSLDSAVALAIRETRRYAKRQLTWLRAEAHAHWLPGQARDRIMEQVAVFLVGCGFSSRQNGIIVE